MLEDDDRISLVDGKILRKTRFKAVRRPKP
jgi:hypothetical protein